MKRIILAIVICCLLSSCGIAIGTIADTTKEAVTYPFSEYVFWGAYKYDNTWEKPYTVIAQKKDHGELLLGVAVSGGGSRSAYFFACVMDELRKIPISARSKNNYADEIDYISSVSGGSLASAYYCLKRYGTKPDSHFFRRFKEAMATDFEIRALGKWIFMGYFFLDFFTYYDRGDLLASVWDSKFFDSTTFSDLAKTETRGAPTLIINSTNINDGDKFVYSTLPDSAFNGSQYFKTMRKLGFIKFATDRSYTPFKTTGFESLKSDIRPYRVSKAVAASAAVPNLIGPITLKDYKRNKLINLVDAGVYDNYGIESLMQVFTKYLDKHPGTKAKILVIDGSGYFQSDHKDYDDFDVSYYSVRPLSISWLRTKSYMEYVFQKARNYKNADGVCPYRNLDFELISLYDVLPSEKKVKYLININEAALKKILRPDVTAKNFLEKVTAIGTRFKLSSEDIKTIENIAHKVVTKLNSNEEK